MDFLTDNNPKGITYIKSILGDKVPSYVQEANSELLTKKASTAFADQNNREYPIDTPSNVWNSVAYFYTQGRTKLASDKANKIEKELVLAASLHGISDDIKDMISHIEGSIKTASADEKEYALCIGNDVYFPISTKEEVIDSAAKIDYNELGPICYKLAASNIIKKAKELNINSKEFIPKKVLEAGEERLFNYTYAKSIAAKRASMTGCNLYNDIVESANKAYREGDCDVTKFATEMFKLDMAYNVYTGKDKDYDSVTNPDPFEALSRGIKKEEAEKFASENVLFNDMFIPLSAFKNEKTLENIDINFSKKVATEIKNIINKDDTYDIGIGLDKLNKETKVELLGILIK